MASTREWFETVEEARRRAKRRLPRPVYMALVAGSEKGVTLQDNVAAFSELRFTPPRIANLPATRDLTTSVLGLQIALPVIASPTGVQAVHPDGEVGVARGTAEAGTAMGLSSFGSMPVESVATVNPKLFFQSYWSGTRDQIIQRTERARQAGAKALIVTLDWSFSNGRDWGSPAIPEKMDLRTLLRLAPEGILKLGYVREWLSHGGLPDLTVPNMAAPGEPSPTFFGVYGEWMQTPPPTWDDIAWLREQWGGPFMVKGVMRPDDARRAVDTGATAISVSNHGGNNLDGTPAAIRALPGDRRRRGRADRGAARRRDPARQRRGQSARARRPGSHDRPRLPVGAGRQRLRGREERLRRAPRRHRLHAARARPVLHRRAVPRRRHRARRVQPGPAQVAAG